MGSHAGVNELHYHGAPPNRYGHHHDYLSIMHEHDEDERFYDAAEERAVDVLRRAGRDRRR